MVVDYASSLISLLDNLNNLPTNPPSLYVDLEGVKLSRHGTISILSLYLATTKKTYLIDVHVLGGAAFSTPNSAGNSLKAILESPTIPKVFFDVRNDSDALFSHYNISVDGIKDLQLMELATRNFSREYIAGLAKCIRKCGTISSSVKAEWQLGKDSTSRLYDPKRGGRYEVFNQRPMKPEIVRYCAWDVALLPELWKAYSAGLRPAGQAFWRRKVRAATEERIKLSQSAGYDPHAKSKTRGPWYPEQIEQDIENWNDDILSLPLEGMVLNEDDQWVDAAGV
jgi:exonuclease 3'-5' domain-containing protein 1